MAERDIPAGRQRPERASRRWTPELCVSVGVLGLAVVAAVAAPWVAPYSPTAITAHAFAPPSGAHLFGTDQLGRDIFSRVVYGARISLGTAGFAVVSSGLIGVTLGLLSGYFGGLLDALVMRAMDIVFAFPAILLAMGLVAIMGAGTDSGAIAIAVVGIPAFARLARAGMLVEREKPYVEAAKALGCSDLRIIFRAVLPNVTGPLLVQAGIGATLAVLLQASLSFLGLGPAPPAPSWGEMLSQSRVVLYQAPWYGIFPGVALTAVVLALNTIADGLQRFPRLGSGPTAGG